MPAARHGPELILAILQAISGNRSPATDGVFANHYSRISAREWDHAVLGFVAALLAVRIDLAVALRME